MIELPTTIYNASGTMTSEGIGHATLANVSSQLGDSGTLVILALAAGVPLAFYVIRRLIALIPSGR